MLLFIYKANFTAQHLMMVVHKSDIEKSFVEETEIPISALITVSVMKNAMQ